MSSLSQTWFEMERERRRLIADASWIPLRLFRRLHSRGRPGQLGFDEETYAVGTLAVPMDKAAQGQQLNWSDIGTNHSHRPWCEPGFYIPSDEYAPNEDTRLGTHLVLEQSFEREEPDVWHLHPDLVIALGLMRDKDEWVRPEEGYASVARALRNPDGTMAGLEIRPAYLLDYLCARNMGLAVTSYRQRIAIVSEDPKFTWRKYPEHETVETGRDRWEGRMRPIRPGYGGSTAVFHVSRTDDAMTDDVPKLGPPSDDNTTSTQWMIEPPDVTLYEVEGEHFHDEWIGPGAASPRIRRDKSTSLPTYLVDSTGTRVAADVLRDGIRWLWFRPHMILDLLQIRGAVLGWHTARTGAVALKGHIGFHFGMNELGDINVLASDIAMLPEWVQHVIAGHNIVPDGGVSAELLQAQMLARPADSIASEDIFAEGLDDLETSFKARYGVDLINAHADRKDILGRVHRFRVRDRASLFELAKDIARLTADSIHAGNIHPLLALPKDAKKPGTLKSLEALLATLINPADARAMLTPLAGVYELRLADAHLPASDIDDKFKMVDLEGDHCSVLTGELLIGNCGRALTKIAQVLKTSSS